MMAPAELRRLADELERKGRMDLARSARNRAAARELGLDEKTVHTTPFSLPPVLNDPYRRLW